MGTYRNGAVTKASREAKAKFEMICHYCGEPANRIDHIVPHKLVHCNVLENLVPACNDCNNKKGSKRSDCRCTKCETAWEAYEFSLLTGEMMGFVLIGWRNTLTRRQIDDNVNLTV